MDEHIITGENIQSVKIERNSRGFTISVRASSVELAMAMYDHAKAATDRRLEAEKE